MCSERAFVVWELVGSFALILFLNNYVCHKTTKKSNNNKKTFQNVENLNTTF